MSEDKDDRVNRILRGNAGMEPKPANIRRRDMQPRGVSFPSLAPGGGIVSSAVRHQRPTPADMPNEPRVPTAPKIEPGAQPAFRRANDPKPEQTAKAVEPPPAPEPGSEQKRAFKAFFEPGDLSQEFNGIER